MDCRPDIETELPQAMTDRDRALDRPRRPLEHGEKPACGTPDQSAFGSEQFAVDLFSVSLGHICADARRRAGYLQGQHRYQHPVARRCRQDAGHEGLDLVDEAIGILAPDYVITAGKLDVSRAFICVAR